MREGNIPASGSESKRIRQSPTLPTRKYFQGSLSGIYTFIPGQVVWERKPSKPSVIPERPLTQFYNLGHKITSFLFFTLILLIYKYKSEDVCF